jgi:hypothetical protein
MTLGVLGGVEEQAQHRGWQSCPPNRSGLLKNAGLRLGKLDERRVDPGP